MHITHTPLFICPYAEWTWPSINACDHCTFECWPPPKDNFLYLILSETPKPMPESEDMSRATQWVLLPWLTHELMDVHIGPPKLFLITPAGTVSHLYNQYVSNFANHKHPTTFPCIWKLSGGQLPQELRLAQDHILISSNTSLQNLIQNHWLYQALVDTGNDPVNEVTEDPFQAADNQIHGEMALLMYFLISYGHNLMGGVGRIASHFLMMEVLADMCAIICMMIQLTHLERKIWERVACKVRPCTHESIEW